MISQQYCGREDWTTRWVGIVFDIRLIEESSARPSIASQHESRGHLGLPGHAKVVQYRNEGCVHRCNVQCSFE